MKVTIFGSTGDLGSECLRGCLDAGHEVTVLVRSPEKISVDLRDRITIVKGDALSLDAVMLSIPKDTDAIIFAVGVDEKVSPENLCTDVTQKIITVMRANDISRFIWCGGGSNILDDDVITFGSRFVRWYAETFLKHRHTDKEHQMVLLEENMDLCWIGVRPLQMKHGKKTGKYRLGFNKYNGMSKITFSDCAHAMVNMLKDDTWIGKAPIIQY
ncbi:MAG: NAD(P)H-binding protein [Halioglobus sp.]